MPSPTVLTPCSLPVTIARKSPSTPFTSNSDPFSSYRGRGCYNYHYLNYEHPRIGTVHKVSQSPRGDWAAGPVRKRQQYTDQDAYEDSYDENDGTPIYGTYFYWDVTPSDENMLGNDNSGDAIAEALFDSATQTSAFDNQG